MLIFLTVSIFVITLGTLLTAGYFMIQAPLEKRKIRARLAGATSSGETVIAGDELLRSDALPGAVDRVLAHLPFFPKLDLFLTQAAVDIPVVSLLLGSASLGLIVLLIGLLLELPMALMGLLAVAFAAAPFGYVAIQRSRRFNKFEELFPDAMDLLARAVRAGHAFTTGFSLIANEMPEPVAGEFRITWQQQNLGLSLSDALKNMAQRMPLPDVQIFVSALLIQRESGGNLGEILDNLSLVVRERFKIYRQVQIYTAEGRLSMYMLTAMPFIAAVIMYFANPEYMSKLFTDPLGRKAILAALIMQIIGYLVIRKIVRIKV